MRFNIANKMSTIVLDKHDKTLSHIKFNMTNKQLSKHRLSHLAILLMLIKLNILECL